MVNNWFNPLLSTAALSSCLSRRSWPRLLSPSSLSVEAAGSRRGRSQNNEGVCVRLAAPPMSSHTRTHRIRGLHLMRDSQFVVEITTTCNAFCRDNKKKYTSSCAALIYLSNYHALVSGVKKKKHPNCKTDGLSPCPATTRD